MQALTVNYRYSPASPSKVCTLDIKLTLLGVCKGSKDEMIGPGQLTTKRFQPAAFLVYVLVICEGPRLRRGRGGRDGKVPRTRTSW